MTKQHTKKAVAKTVPDDWVYVLRTCHKDGIPTYYETSFRWVESGYVKCPDWKPTKSCGNGLHGWLWGIGDMSVGCVGSHDCVWQVLKVSAAKIIDIEGKVKFPECWVEYTGDFHTAFWMVRLEAVKRGLDKPTSGNSSPSSTSGKWSPSSTSGDSSPSSTSGVSSPSSTSGDSSPSICANYNGKARTGENGFIALTWWDKQSKRPRLTVGYVGEEIEAHTWYEVNDKGELEKCDEQEMR